MKMGFLFFDFRSFDEEIERKLVSRKTDSEVLMQDLLLRLKEKQMESGDLRKIERLYQEVLRDDPSAKAANNYLNHPIRVTADLAGFCDKIDYELMVLGLCHNLKEKMGDRFKEVGEEWFPSKVRQSIELLTIDRAQETDGKYLEKFYSGIASGPEKLMLLKALDKLDNTLSWVLFDVKAYEPKVILDYVCPRIAAGYPRFERYLRELTHYVLTDAAKNKFRVINTAAAK